MSQPTEKPSDSKETDSTSQITVEDQNHQSQPKVFAFPGFNVVNFPNSPTFQYDPLLPPFDSKELNIQQCIQYHKLPNCVQSLFDDMPNYNFFQQKVEDILTLVIFYYYCTDSIHMYLDLLLAVYVATNIREPNILC